jgi:hypothetical protein
MFNLFAINGLNKNVLSIKKNVRNNALIIFYFSYLQFFSFLEEPFRQPAGQVWSQWLPIGSARAKKVSFF